jgi:antitoxin (DNA-binding transcriptional repressor) of toxin-antitoxin stability system
MNASTFKAQCLALLDEVSTTGESIRILKRGKAVAEIVPPSATGTFPQHTLVGRGRVTGDIVKPILPIDAWDADARNIVR